MPSSLRFCAFRFRGTSQTIWAESCGANLTVTPAPDACSMLEILIRAYCMHQYQSINHLPY